MREEELAELIRHYGPLMRYIMASILRDKHDIDDCLAESAMRIWENFDTYDETIETTGFSHKNPIDYNTHSSWQSQGSFSASSLYHHQGFIITAYSEYRLSVTTTADNHTSP